jgi:hypothetical protein
MTSRGRLVSVAIAAPALCAALPLAPVAHRLLGTSALPCTSLFDVTGYYQSPSGHALSEQWVHGRSVLRVDQSLTGGY